MEEQFRFRDIDEISETLGDNASDGQNDEEVTGTEVFEDPEEEVQTKKRRYVNSSDEDDKQDPMPYEYRHIRKSERVVKNSFYLTIANLVGQGLSISEACKAVCIVGNGMFKRSWKEASTCEDTFDQGFDLIYNLILILFGTNLPFSFFILRLFFISESRTHCPTLKLYASLSTFLRHNHYL